MTRRSPGEGWSIRAHKGGFRTGYTDPSGKRRHIYARTAKEAKTKRDAAIREANAPPPPPEPIRFQPRTVHDGVGESVWVEGIHRIAPIYTWRTDEAAVRAGLSALLLAGTVPCGICGKAMRSSLEVQIDHDHATRTVRGYLCRDCNLALGYFHDSLDLLTRAYAYLSASHNDLMEQLDDAMSGVGE